MGEGLRFAGVRIEPGGRMTVYLKAGVVRVEPIEADRARPVGFYDFDLKPTPSPLTGRFEKSQVGYSAGKAGARCGICEYFEKPGACEKVSGTIGADAWCELFEAMHG